MENNIYKIDVDKAWNQFKERITDSSEQESKPTINLQRRILKYAASVLIILGLGTAGYFAYDSIIKTNKHISLETQKYETRSNFYLPDGSVISMNNNSKIYYPKQFNVKERYVEVKGEVFFNVENNPSKPFVISADKAKIKVLGTSFNVRTDLPDGAVEVFVKSGKVKLYKSNHEEEAAVLGPGYIGILLNDKIIKRKNNDINYLAWKTGKMLFKETKLQNVVNTLNNAYHVNIEIKDPKIKNLTLSASFNNEPVEDVLKIISKTFNIQIIKKGKHHYIIANNG